MIPNPKNYAIWPAVVPAHAVSELTVLACENVYIPRDGQAFTLRVNRMNADIADYHSEAHKQFIPMTAKDGVLKASYAFEGEGAYWVDLLAGEQLLQKLQVFALEEDLYHLRPLKGDLHAHSYRSDGKRDPAALAGHFREQGYDFFALTDHNRYYPSREAQAAFADVELGMTILNGEEVHTPDSMIHIVHVGGERSVADRYRLHREEYKKEVHALMDALPDEFPGHLRETYAMAQWAGREIHRAGGVCIYAHPFWRPKSSRCYNASEWFAARLMTSGFFDALELVGGMEYDGINMTLALWNELRAEGLKLPVVGSSDIHEITTHHFAYLFTIVFAADNTREAILDAIRKGNTVAVEASGGEEEREYRCYGSLRLVTYAQFLLQRYFPGTRRIAEGEGVMMRRYLIGNEDGALLSACARRVDSHWRRFAGIDPPILPTERLLERAAHWRGIHLQGPATRGGMLELYGDGKNKRQV